MMPTMLPGALPPSRGEPDDRIPQRAHERLSPSLPPLPVLHGRGRTVSIWLFLLLAFAFVIMAAYFLDGLGAGASLVGMLLAVVPLTFVLLGVHFVDRWEPEPRRVKIFAVAWGALIATGLTLLVGIGLTRLVGTVPDLLAGIIQAPIIEEIWKGLGVFLIFLMARRTFDGPVDGVVYGALVGAGFAFTENVQYFAISLIEGGGSELTLTFVLRAILSPFAHAMFTSLTGLAMGFAARRNGTTGAVFRAGFWGGVGATVLHAFWNASALLTDFFATYVTLQMPLFAGFIIGAILLQREEARFTENQLRAYVATGWLTPEEVTMLTTTAGRRAGLAWATNLRGNRRALMRAFISDAVALAHARQRLLLHKDPQSQHDETVLLQRMSGHRAALLAW